MRYYRYYRYYDTTFLSRADRWVGLGWARDVLCMRWVECGVWCVECGVWSVECGVWGVVCVCKCVECGGADTT